ncbi:SGNH/GDSL hydrolase family protein [Microbacterium sp. p3-SID336]|uniref:SGNH/GDSL hydrolase family protein n=1 Tax=Microbacterium sp. p3-SID336 TaxID=2916212 RepID=UPI0021A83398|nr:SGNH/GDSL hydrolase family protein [Microbacterium sp. p3-SID336]MCT1477144.1 SGNH/GDSL hydrolase family protein [Microbacterium sp. p3-SID336]
MSNAESPAPASAAADLQRLTAALADPAPLNWLLTGDSITHGLVHTQGGRSYPEHLHELVRGELARVRDIVVNSAISGNRIEDILDDWERRVASWNPDVVTLMIGTNDVSTAGVRPVLTAEEYAASLREFVTRARGIGAIVVLQTPPAVDGLNAPERARIGEFAEAVRQVAAAEDVLLVDQYARYAELGNGGVPWGLMGDPFHPNAAGHAALALELATVLGIRPQPSRTLQLLEALVATARLNA